MNISKRGEREREREKRQKQKETTNSSLKRVWIQLNLITTMKTQKKVTLELEVSSVSKKMHPLMGELKQGVQQAQSQDLHGFCCSTRKQYRFRKIKHDQQRKIGGEGEPKKEN